MLATSIINTSVLFTIGIILELTLTPGKQCEGNGQHRTKRKFYAMPPLYLHREINGFSGVR